MMDPEDVRVISEFVKDWRRIRGGGLIVELKGTKFPKLVVTETLMIPALEYKTQYSCVLQVVSPSEINEKAVKAYRKLKQMECELMYRGIFRKKPLFIPINESKVLKKRIKGYFYDDTLIREIEGNGRLLELIQSIKPDEIKIPLVSIDVKKYSHRASDLRKINIFDAMTEFYENPKEITWTPIVSKVMMSRYGTDRLKRGMFDILRILSDVILKITYDLL